MSIQDRGYPDFQDHLQTLHEKGLLRTIDTPINKDTEMHPLVRWQFRGGLPESQRSAFLFTNIKDSKHKVYKMSVVVGALAATPEIYSLGMGVPVDEIGDKWTYAIANPIEPVVVDEGPCQEIVLVGDNLIGPGKGLETLPVPISSPGWDSAPYFTATGVITKDPETGVLVDRKAICIGLSIRNVVTKRWRVPLS
jgi:UbiD family decarboxylase